MAISFDLRQIDGAIAPASTLRSAAAGAVLEVVAINCGHACAARLRELCILEGQQIRIERRSDPLLLEVKGSLIAIDLDTAAGIEVRSAQCL